MATQTIDLGDGFIVEADTSTTTPEQLMKMKRRAMVAGVKPWKLDSGESFEGAAKRTARSAGETALDLLPAAGGAAGGVIGGVGGTIGGFGVGGVPGAVGGAVVGGSGGEAARQLLRRALGMDAPQTPMDALRSIGEQGGWQGANEATGGLLRLGADRFARPLMRMAMNPTKPLEVQAVRSAAGNKAAMPSVIETALKERMGGTGEESLRAVSALKREAGRFEDRVASRGGARALDIGELIARAEKRMGVKFNSTQRQEFIQKVRDRANELLDKPAKGVLSRRRTVVSGTEMRDLKQAAAEEGRAAIKGDAAGTRNLSADPDLDKDIADLARRNLKLIPGMKEATRRSQSLLGLERAVEASVPSRAEALRNLGIAATVGTAAGAIPGDATGNNFSDGGLAALMALLATNRGNQSRAALALTDPLFQRLLGQAPRGAGALLFPPEGFPAPADSTR